MTTQLPSSTQLRPPAILLAISPLPFLGVFAAGLFGFVGKVTTTFDKITPEVMAEIRLPWAIVFISIFLAFSIGNLGLLLLANQHKDTKARLVAWLTMLGILVSLVVLAFNTYLRLTMMDFSAPTLGQTPQWEVSHTLVYIYYLVNFASIVTACIGLYITGWLRRASLVVGVLSGLLFIAGLVPSITDYTPPFVFVFLWLALGVGLLRRRTA